jgi:hypothetical protein
MALARRRASTLWSCSPLDEVPVGEVEEEVPVGVVKEELPLALASDEVPLDLGAERVPVGLKEEVLVRDISSGALGNEEEGE